MYVSEREGGVREGGRELACFFHRERERERERERALACFFHAKPSARAASSAMAPCTCDKSDTLMIQYVYANDARTLIR
jgi:hypothetical protein